jgi:flagellar biosynthesis protein FliP
LRSSRSCRRALDPGDDDVIHRIVVVLSLLRTALGTATASAQRRHRRTCAVPHRLRDGTRAAERLRHRHQAARNNDQRREAGVQALNSPAQGIHAENVREKDLALFSDLRASRDQRARAALTAHPGARIHDLKLKRAFEIGFLLFLPFR